jgi:hypothetical protein
LKSTGGSNVEAMIEEKARTVLTKSEHSRFTFYRLEYMQGFIPVQTFVRFLLELLNTADKVGLPGKHFILSVLFHFSKFNLIYVSKCNIKK